METLCILKDLCKDIGGAIYDDVLPINPHSIIARRQYKKIEKYHPKIIEFYNSLFNVNFSKPEMRFGRKWRYKKSNVYFGLAKRLDETLYSLSHEEGHRFYHKVNSFSERNDYNSNLVFGTITEGIAFYVCGKFMGEIGFEKISKGLEVWADIHGDSSYDLFKSLPNPEDITKFLYSKKEEFFKEFVRLDPLEAIKILNPELKIENFYGYAICYPSIEELIHYASYSFLHEKDKV